MSMFTGMDQSMNTTDDHSIFSYYVQTGSLVVEMLNSLLLSVSSNGGNVNIASLFKNSTYVSLLLSGVNNTDTQLITGLFSGYIRSDKVTI